MIYNICHSSFLKFNRSMNNKFSFKTIWSILMTIVYVAMAGVILFTPYLLKYNFRENDPDTDDFLIPRIVLGIGILAYGLFRGYRVFKDNK